MVESLAGLERLETEAFALVVFAAKVITWTALLLLAAIVEAGLVRKIFRAEFGGRKSTAVARDDFWSTIGPMRDRYIRASELRSFEFCERAWRLERDGKPSTLERERAEGRREHAARAGAAAKTRTASGTAAALIGLGIMGLVIGIVLWGIHR
jgi:hypothetical protein